MVGQIIKHRVMMILPNKQGVDEFRILKGIFVLEIKRGEINFLGSVTLGTRSIPNTKPRKSYRGTK